MSIKYPEVEVRLSGEDGNAFFIIARVAKALKGAGVSADDVQRFRAEAMAGDYDNVLSTCSAWVSCT